jgi:hypothetical protein
MASGMTPERLLELDALVTEAIAKGSPLVGIRTSEAAALLHALRNAQFAAEMCKELAEERKAKLEKAAEALEWIRQTVHRAHNHPDPIDECRMNTCGHAQKTLRELG